MMRLSRIWTPRKLSILAASGLLAALAVLHAQRFDFVCDDAYISLRYAQNLAHYGELVWNLGERVEGYTNFLWTVLLAGLHLLGPELPGLSLTLGRLFGAATVVLLIFFGLSWRQVNEENPTEHLGDPVVWLAPALTVAWASFATWSSGGLETAMFTFLLTAAWASLFLLDPRHVWISGTLFALAAMTRPEGLLFGAIALPVAAWRALVSVRGVSPRTFRAAVTGSLRWGLPLLLIYGSYFAWRYAYYGYLFPNTYYIKATEMGSPAALASGWRYLRTFVRDYRLSWALPLAALGGWRALRHGRRGTAGPLLLQAYLWVSLVLYGAYVIRVGGDFMAMHRFFVPLVPMLAVLLQEGVRGLGDLVSSSSRRAVEGLLVAGLTAFLAVTSYRLGTKTLTTLRVTSTGYWGAYDGMESVAFMRKFAEDRILIGRWLRERVPKDALIAVGGAGAIVYASGLQAIDSFGLSDLYVAHRTKPVSSRPGHQKLAPLSYLLSRKPDIMCSPGLVHHQDWEYRPSPAERARWERRGYEYFCATPRGLKPTHYCCLKRIDRSLGLLPVSSYRY